ncbi:hypothetical protein NMG60_11000864 [Bertholletia excelsa]
MLIQVGELLELLGGFEGFEIMLRKRTRSHQKDQIMGHPMSDAIIPEPSFNSEILGQKQKTNSFFSVPGLFVGFSPKVSESDSIRSPTSPLDFRVFPNLAVPFRSPKSSSAPEGHHRRWACSKVGLGIIDSLDDDNAKQTSGKILRSSDSKSILFGPQMRIRNLNFPSRVDSFEAPRSLPKNYGVFPEIHTKQSDLQTDKSNVMFGIGENPFEPEPSEKFLSCSLDSGRLGSHLAGITSNSANLGAGNFGDGKNPVTLEKLSASKLNSFPISIGSTCDFIGSLSASEIELSEDYTCIKTYGPNPKTTHIFGDCILECHSGNLTDLCKNKDEEKIQLPPVMAVKRSEIPTSYPPSDFLSFCYTCKKELEGEDIYMYRFATNPVKNNFGLFGYLVCFLLSVYIFGCF